jgi:DegV family protein with EDD domain
MIKLTTDSTCDLNEEIIKKYDIEVIPVHIVVDEKVYNDNVDIYPRDVFHFVEEENKTCRTAAINVYEYHQFFEPLAKKYETVIHVSLGSEFSSCHQNANLAARGFDNVHVIDSANLSSGSGFLVYRLAQLIKDEASQSEVLKTAEDLVKKINGSFVIDTLDYLYKGGRCSGLEMVGTKMLKIKPTIEVFNGKMRVAGKCRGSFERCVKNYVTERLKDIDNIDKKTIFITNAESSDELVEYVTNKIKTDYDFNEIVMCQAGCTISAHCGPTTLGIFYLEK